MKQELSNANQMIPAGKLKQIQELVAAASREELIWLNGYLAGILSTQAVTEENTTANGQVAKPGINRITIAYGTETGNSKKLALDFASKAKKIGVNAKLVSLDQYRLKDLPNEEYFFTVISTQGEGEPPSAAKKFYDHIHQNGFKLEKMKFGVLALGDMAYPLFCKAGEDVDQQLQNLGGKRIVSLQRCDVDYETEAGTWFAEVLKNINGHSVETPAPAVAVKKSTGKKIFKGAIVSNVNLNDRGSAKRTHHLEIAVPDVEYKPGDSIGIHPSNPLHIVNAIIELTGVDKEKRYNFRNEDHDFFQLLKSKMNIIYLPERLVKKYASIVQQDIPETKIGLLDLLKIYPVKDHAQLEEVISIMEPITPRLYSIASSPEAHQGEIHLTIARDSFLINEELKYGLCSDLLTQLDEDDELEFYIHKNARFKLPEEDKHVIMIGPGTGVAPFRSFIAERDATGASGKNWLFFGDQHFETDFLYQSELQSWMQTGVLSKLNVAFSRDQQEKVYVQHKMEKHGAEFFEWMQAGAYIYVCGAKDPMSIDVEQSISPDHSKA